MKERIDIHSRQLEKEKDRSWAISYVSLTKFGIGSKEQQSSFEKKVDVLFEAFRLLAEPKRDILFGCHKGGITEAEARTYLEDNAAYETLASFTRKGSFCIRTKDLEVLAGIFKAVWNKVGLGNLFLVFGPEQVDAFLEKFEQMQKFWEPGFYSFACGYSNQCDFICASYDSNMIDIYSVKLPVADIETAIFESARANSLEIGREEAGQ